MASLSVTDIATPSQSNSSSSSTSSSSTTSSTGSTIFVAGDAYVDVVAAPIERLPTWGGDVVVPAITLHAGGSGANTAIDLSRLGVKTILATAIGDDGFGTYMESRLSCYDINYKSSTIIHKATPTGTCIVLSGRHDRGFVSCGGANDKFTSSHLWAMRDQIVAIGHIHLTGYFVLPAIQTDELIQLLAYLQSRGVTTSMDPQYDASGNWTGIDGHLFRLLPYINVFMPNDSEANGISRKTTPDEAAVVISGHMHRESLLIIKCGAGGSRAYVRGALVASQPAFVAHLLDSTGAGDAFDSAFMATIITELRHKHSSSTVASPSPASSSSTSSSSDTKSAASTTGSDVHMVALSLPTIQRALIVGNASGAIRVAIIGASDNAPSMAQLEAHIAATPITAITAPKL